VFISIVHRRSSAAAPRHQRRLRQSQRQTHHQEDLHISPTERSTILHQRRSQPTIIANGHKSTPIYCLQQPAALPPQQLFVFSSKFANHQRQQPHLSSSTSRNTTIHSALTFSSDNGSTGPRPAATPQTPPPLPSHRRAQAESRSPASCVVADSNDNSSQKLGKQENRSCKHN